MARIRVMSPVGEVKQERIVRAAAARGVDGAGRRLHRQHQAQLRSTGRGTGKPWEHYGVRAVVRRRKANAATPAPPELIAELSKECDVVFAGSAD